MDLDSRRLAGMAGDRDGGAEVRLVILESPYAGDVEANVAYARTCVRDSLLRGEAPITSHLLYTQAGILNDDIPAERQHGIDAGLAWLRAADASVVYTDRGISRGMEYGIAAAEAAGIPVEFRSLGAEDEHDFRPGLTMPPEHPQFFAMQRTLSNDRQNIQNLG